MQKRYFEFRFFKNFLTRFFISTIFFLFLNNSVEAFSGSVFFSEIQRMGTTNSSSDEWIELKNSADHDINLNGWILKTEDLSVNASLDGVIKSGGYFLLERTDDNSAYQVNGDFIYSGSLGNSGESLILIDLNGDIVDKIDSGSWQSGDSSSRKSMLKDDNGNWIDGEIDGDPQSGKMNDEIFNQENEENVANGTGSVVSSNISDGNGQEGQGGQDEQENFINNIFFNLQSPSYILDKTEDLDNYFCDNSKDECKINFNFEKTFEEFGKIFSQNGQNFSKSDYYCQIIFGTLSTGQENKCNPNTVIFPIGETNVNVKIFQKNSLGGDDLFIIEKNILIKNPESILPSEVLEINSTENSPAENSILEKKDLSIKQGISKEKFRFKSILLNQTDGDFVEIFCLNCDKKINIGGFKIYSSKNFFYFPTKKFGKYNLGNKNSIKIFLKKSCENFKENIFKNVINDNIENNENNNNINKNILIKPLENLDKNDKTVNPSFCTNKKTGLVSTNGSLFLMNSNGEILDSVCWQNGKEIKGKTLNEINILKNNNLWKGECLNTTSLKKGEIFERENFSGYNQSDSWKKFNTSDLGEEKFSEENNGENISSENSNSLNNGSSGNLILNNSNLNNLDNFNPSEFKENKNDKDYDNYSNKTSTGIINKNKESLKNVDIFKNDNNTYNNNNDNNDNNDNIDNKEKINEKNNLKTQSEIQLKIDKVRNEIKQKIDRENKDKTDLKNIFNKKTKFHKIYLPKEKSRIFRVKGRTLPFVKVTLLSESGEFFEVNSDEKGYFKIFFDKLLKGKNNLENNFEKKFDVKFFQNGELIIQKELSFLLNRNWFSSDYKKKNLITSEDIAIDNLNNSEESQFNSVYFNDTSSEFYPKYLTPSERIIFYKEDKNNSWVKDSTILNKKDDVNYGLKIVKKTSKYFKLISNFFGFDY